MKKTNQKRSDNLNEKRVVEIETENNGETEKYRDRQADRKREIETDTDRQKGQAYRKNLRKTEKGQTGPERKEESKKKERNFEGTSTAGSLDAKC